MIVTLNGRFLTQDVTGVQRYSREILFELNKLASAKAMSITVIVVVPKVVDLEEISDTYSGLTFRSTASCLSGHLWEQFVLPLYVKGVLFCPGNAAPILSLMGRARVVVTVHDISFHYFPASYSKRYRLFYTILTYAISKFSDRVITVSKSERHNLSLSCLTRTANIDFVQNGGLSGDKEVSLISRSNGHTLTDLGAMHLLYVGSLSKRKNISGVLQCAAAVYERYGIKTKVVGSVPEGLKGVAKSSEQAVEYLGQINDTDQLEELYKSSLCLLFPSFFEASPLPPIEAMQCGCPVVASSIPSMEERCGDYAVYCEPNDPGSIFNAVEKLILDSEFREELIQNGYLFSRKYTWSRCTARTLELLSSVAVHEE